jgi:type IV secretion system protein VirD4
VEKRRQEIAHSPLLIGRRLSQAKRAVGFTPQPPALKADADDWVTYDGTSHIVTTGPTGSGKSCHIIGNALAFEGSMIAFDSKGDIFKATARRRREMGQEVHVIDLRDSNRSGNGSLNPLDLAALTGTESAVIARSLAAHIVARTGEERDSFWTNWAETGIAGAIGYALGQPAEKRHMGTVFELFNSDDLSYTIAVLLDTESQNMTRATRAALAGILQLPERDTRPSVFGTIQSALRLWDSELVCQATSSTSFDLDALINRSDERPMTLYFIVPSYRGEAYRPLLRLWFGGLLAALMQRQHMPRTRTLIVSDETASFGKIESFITAATQARSYGVTLWTHWQNIAQQIQIYGTAGAHTLIDNAGVLQVLGAPNHRAAEEFASLLGGVSADEIMALGPRDQLAFIDGKLQRLRRFRYFEETRFAGQYDPVMKGLF